MATFPHHYVTKSDRCVLTIDGNMYDLTAWRHTHPGGSELLDKYHNEDATECFYALHSKEAIERLSRLHKVKRAANEESAYASKKAHVLAFRDFRGSLEKQGWFKRDYRFDAVLISLCVSMLVIGTVLATTWPVLSTILIGIAMQQAGWLGHDYGHGRGVFSKLANLALSGPVNGFSPKWWSHKHNTHHCFPNRMEVDVDIHNEPLLHLWFPKEDSDVWYRKYQHLYYPFVYCFLYVSWRMQSIQFALSSHDWVERILIAVNYMWLACLPWKVALASIILGGLMVAIVVTANHQCEDLIETEADFDFVKDQFTSTRGVVCSDWLTGYLFGGMQYQLEHHLFPTMPRYYYPALRPILKAFAEKEGLPFKVSGVAEIMSLNYQVMKKYAGKNGN